MLSRRVFLSLAIEIGRTSTSDLQSTKEDDVTGQRIDALGPLPSATSQFEVTISLVRTAKLQSTAAWRTRQLDNICAQWVSHQIN